jgi:hypothetical protein
LAESDAVVGRERARVASEGWGARLLDLQASDGTGVVGPYVVPGWIATTDTLLMLRELGLDASSERARSAVDRVRRTTWGPEFKDAPYFDGEEEACINGRVLACGAYFGEPSDSLVERLLAEQRDDGGWNCWPRSKRSSFHSTICVLEGLLEYERCKGAASTVRDARHRAHEYLLDRGCSGGSPPARSSIRSGRGFRFRRAGITTCCGDSITCVAPACRATRAPPRQWNWCKASAIATAGGRSKIRTKANSTSRWKDRPAHRAAGIHCALCVC